MAINLRPMVSDKFKEFLEKHPQLSFGEILYCITRDKFLNGKPTKKDTTWLKNIKDNDFITAIEQAIADEAE